MSRPRRPGAPGAYCTPREFTRYSPVSLICTTAVDVTFGFPLVVVTIRSRRHLAEWALVLNLEMVTCAVTWSESLPLLATMLN